MNARPASLSESDVSMREIDARLRRLVPGAAVHQMAVRMAMAHGEMISAVWRIRLEESELWHQRYRRRSLAVARLAEALAGQAGRSDAGTT